LGQSHRHQRAGIDKFSVRINNSRNKKKFQEKTLMPEEIILTVNGKPHKVQAEPDTPLLYVLRNELGLTGVQFGCGEETCGACMVLIGDQAKPSCKLPVSDVGRSRITTLEGLIEDGEMHPVQRAFLEEQASQCGYCINGMIMTISALLWKTPHPSDRQIRAALDGTLCRCGSHLRILRAVRKAEALLSGIED
jgi:aerobic-type carbon monoxide dehydrogenase small subunit (CoxS/CutS family)